MLNQSDDWRDHRIYVTEALERGEIERREILKQVSHLRADISGLRAKTTMWAGTVTFIVGTAISIVALIVGK